MEKPSKIIPIQEEIKTVSKPNKIVPLVPEWSVFAVQPGNDSQNKKISR